MNCTQLADVAAGLALGVVTGRERADAIAHLDRCEACREEVRQLMQASDGLLGLLPAADPPAGFAARVLARLGLGPAGATRGARPGKIAAAGRPARRRGPGRGPRRAGGPSRPGPARRILAVAAVCLALIAAGLGGWRISAATSPASHAVVQAPLISASLVTGSGKTVGTITWYSGSPRWLSMSVDMASGNETVTCQLAGADGRFTTIGSFRLTSGNGAWGTANPGINGTVRGARLVAADGTVLASASFRG
jgi:hypothetical protein